VLVLVVVCLFKGVCVVVGGGDTCSTNSSSNSSGSSSNSLLGSHDGGSQAQAAPLVVHGLRPACFMLMNTCRGSTRGGGGGEGGYQQQLLLCRLGREQQGCRSEEGQASCTNAVPAPFVSCLVC
jgi:hypothetical protein